MEAEVAAVTTTMIADVATMIVEEASVMAVMPIAAAQAAAKEKPTGEPSASNYYRPRQAMKEELRSRSSSFLL
jgi:hypothetical protein